jgi:predicted small secreted protein
MKINRFVFGALFGLAAGYTLATQINNHKRITPEQALNNVKKALKNKLSIEGSWIQMVPEKLESDLLEYTVYKGGITANEQNRIKHYDFAVDAKTGTIIELK